MEIREAVKLLRRERGWTQEGMARAIGITYAAVSAWENAKNRPSRAMLEKLAGLTTGELAEFFRRESGLPSNESLRPRSYNVLIRAADILLEQMRAGSGAAAELLDHYADVLNQKATELSSIPEAQPSKSISRSKKISARRRS